MYLKVRVTNTYRELCHSLVHSPAGHNKWDWPRPKAGAGNFLQVTHVGDRGSRTYTIIAAFLGTLAGRWIRSRATRSQASVRVGCWNCRWQLKLLCYNVSPCNFIIIKICLCDKITGRETGECYLSSAGWLPEWLQWPVLDQAKARSSSFIRASHMGFWGQVLGPSSPAFPGALARSWIQNESALTGSSAQMGCWHCCITMLAPEIVKFDVPVKCGILFRMLMFVLVIFKTLLLITGKCFHWAFP